jgi:GTP pyrophosphokinase
MGIDYLLEFLFKGKKRKDGSPFTSHFYATRDILKDEGITDTTILNSALLHDVIEDTYITKDYLAMKYSQEVANIVELISKWDSWRTSYCKMKGNLDEMEVYWKRYPEVVLIKRRIVYIISKLLMALRRRNNTNIFKRQSRCFCPFFGKVLKN